MKNKYEKSIDILFQAYKLEPTNFLVIKYIAENYEKAGDSKKALEYFKLAIKYSDQKTSKNLQDIINRLEKNNDARKSKSYVPKNVIFNKKNYK